MQRAHVSEFEVLKKTLKVIENCCYKGVWTHLHGKLLTRGSTLLLGVLRIFAHPSSFSSGHISQWRSQNRSVTC